MLVHHGKFRFGHLAPRQHRLVGHHNGKESRAVYLAYRRRRALAEREIGGIGEERAKNVDRAVPVKENGAAGLMERGALDDAPL